MQYRSLVMSDITSDFPGLKSYSSRPICVPNGHKHPIGTGDTLLVYQKSNQKSNQKSSCKRMLFSLKVLYL